MSAVPTIDISQRAAAEEVARTCEETGFLIICGHGFPAPLLARAQRELFAFFDRPVEVKNRWHPTGASKQRGYHGFATRGLAYTLGAQTPPDLRETVFLGPVDDHRAYYANLPEAATSYAPNVIPDELEATLVSLYREYERLARDMMRVFALALKLPEGYFDGPAGPAFQHPVLPPLSGAGKAAASGTAAHRRAYRLRCDDDPRRHRRGRRSRSADARRELGRREAEAGRIRRQSRRHDGALDQRQVGLDAASRRQSGARHGGEPPPIDRDVRASELRPAHRMRADLPRRRRKASLPGDHGRRAHQAQDRAQPRNRVAPKPTDDAAPPSAARGPTMRRAHGNLARLPRVAWRRPRRRRCIDCR